jgi:hypothetical protein
MGSESSPQLGLLGSHIFDLAFRVRVSQHFATLKLAAAFESLSPMAVCLNCQGQRFDPSPLISEVRGILGDVRDILTL